MSEMTAAASATASTPASAKRGPGRPFRPGQTGNAGGKRRNGKRYQELFDAMLADLGGDLGATERVLLGQVCDLMVRSERAKDADIAVRAANASARLLSGLQARRAKREGLPGPTLADILREDRDADD